MFHYFLRWRELPHWEASLLLWLLIGQSPLWHANGAIEWQALAFVTKRKNYFGEKQKDRKGRMKEWKQDRWRYVTSFQSDRHKGKWHLKGILVGFFVKVLLLSTNLIQTIIFPQNWFSNVSPFSAVSCSDSYLEDSMMTLVVIPGIGSQSSQCYSSIINVQLFRIVCLQLFLLLFIHWGKKEDTPLFHSIVFWHDYFSPSARMTDAELNVCGMCVKLARRYLRVFEFQLKMATLSGLTLIWFDPDIHCLSNGFAWLTGFFTSLCFSISIDFHSAEPLCEERDDTPGFTLVWDAQSVTEHYPRVEHNPRIAGYSALQKYSQSVI